MMNWVMWLAMKKAQKEARTLRRYSYIGVDILWVVVVTMFLRNLKVGENWRFVRTTKQSPTNLYPEKAMIVRKDVCFTCYTKNTM